MKTYNARKIALIAWSILTLLTLLTNSAFSATYYVNSRCSNGGDGTSTDCDGGADDAWNEITDVNSKALSDGDTVKFKRGDTFDDAKLTLNSTLVGKSGITIEAYGSGNKPVFDGNAIIPIRIDHALLNLTIKDISIKGFGTYGDRAQFRNIHGLTIDGLDIDGRNSTIYFRNDGINIRSVDGDIEIKNCTIQYLMKNTFENTVASWEKLDCVGIIFWYPDSNGNKTSGTVSIHDNVIHDIYTDGIHLAGVRTHGDGTYGTKIYNNTISRCGEGTIDLKHSRYVDVYNNDLSYNDYGVAGGAAGIYWGPALIESGLQATEFSLDARDNVIRNNYLHDSAYTGFASAGDNTLIYDNYFEDICNPINIQDPGVKVYDNEFLLSTGKPDDFDYGSRYIGTKLSAIRVDDEITKNSGYIYNNTIHITSSDLLYGIAYKHKNNSGFVINNNVIHMTRNQASVFQIYSKSGSNDPVVTDNKLYGVHTNRVYWEGAIYDSTDQAAWIAAGHTGAVFGDASDIDIEAFEYQQEDQSLKPPTDLNIKIDK
jgi:parallel beta helix pectate lyase-like protein